MEALLDHFTEILVGVLIVAVPLIGSYARAYLKKKTSLMDNEFIQAHLNELIKSVVWAVQQQIVDELKRTGRFTKERQAEAFEKAREKILVQLTEQARAILGEMYNDYVAYIETKIDEQVVLNKLTIKSMQQG